MAQEQQAQAGADPSADGDDVVDADFEEVEDDEEESENK